MVNYRVPSNVLVQEVVSETVLLDIEKGAYFELDEMGTDMLKRLKVLGDPEKAIKDMLNDYDVTEEVLSHDFLDLLAQLESHGLVEKCVASG